MGCLQILNLLHFLFIETDDKKWQITTATYSLLLSLNEFVRIHLISNHKFWNSGKLVEFELPDLIPPNLTFQFECFKPILNHKNIFKNDFLLTSSIKVLLLATYKNVQ